MPNHSQDNEPNDKRLPGEKICNFLTAVGLIAVIGFGGLHIVSDVRAAGDEKTENIPQELPDAAPTDETETEDESMPEEEVYPLIQDTASEEKVLPDSITPDTIAAKGRETFGQSLEEGLQQKTDSARHHTDSISPKENGPDGNTPEPDHTESVHI